VTDELVIEIDGDGVHLATLDAPRLLELAAAYFDLLAKVAADRDEALELRGLRAFEKCASIATTPSNSATAARAIADASDLLASVRRPGYGLVEPVRRVRTARARLPTGTRARILLGEQRSDLVTEPTESPPMPRPAGVTTVRAYLQRVGGATPRATFQARTEPRPFTVDLQDAAQAEQLGQSLYKTLDIEVRLLRDADGAIEGGQLAGFHPVAVGDALGAWRAWFRDNAVETIADVEGDDGGGDDGTR
jgi:hypothetical protein